MPGLTRIQGYGHVATQYGLEEAIFLDSVVYWCRTNRQEGRNFRDGRWWTYNTLDMYTEVFPWWTVKQLRRIINSCKEQGALLVGCYNEDQRDKTLWYSPSDELLALYGDAHVGESICPNGQTEVPERADENAQMGSCYKGNHVATHVATQKTPVAPTGGDARKGSKPKPKSEPYRLDWFEAFWKRYPRKDNKQVALRAWDKLKPDLETCKRMSDALERDKRSPQWNRDQGEFIPLPSTWINQRRWENQGVDHSQLPDTDGAGWAPDPEVI